MVEREEKKVREKIYIDEIRGKDASPADVGWKGRNVIYTLAGLKKWNSLKEEIYKEIYKNLKVPI